jgi:uncharacterized protein YecE (DUF72 family)
MSGFSYPEWIGRLYPEGTKRADFLARYAERFDAVEVNMTFRRRPQEQTLVKWRETVPEGFRFAVKAHQRITHHKRLVDVSDDVEVFVRNCMPLRDRLGPLLFQIPPTLAFERNVLDAFLGTLPPVVHHAFEPRHESFAAAEVDDLLASHGVARCLNDGLLDPSGYSVTGRVAYFRFRQDTYTEDVLAERAALVRSLAEQADTYVFFKHEGEPEGVRLALRFRELVTAAA